MKIGLAAVSMDIVPKDARRRDIVAFIGEAAAAGCQMVFFPEYVNCQRTAAAVADWDAGHEHDCFALHTEPVPGGPCAGFVVEECRRHGIWCGFGVNERRPDGVLVNTYALDEKGNVVAQSPNRRHLLVVDVPVKKGCNDVRFALRRPAVYRRIVEAPA